MVTVVFFPVITGSFVHVGYLEYNTIRRNRVIFNPCSAPALYKVSVNGPYDVFNIKAFLKGDPPEFPTSGPYR